MIRLLEPDSNKRGDLFGRLMQDYFHALGYHNFRLEIPKSGREIDLRGFHRVEDRKAIAECKAVAAPVGGADVNKFVGALSAEQQDGTSTTVGYFVSLGGFTSAAREQEDDLPTRRCILVDGADVEGELITGHIVVSREAAVEQSARCAALSPLDLQLYGSPELLGYDAGWVWCIRYAAAGTVTGFACVHADGHVLGATAARQVIDADASVGGDLHELDYLCPDPEPSDASEAAAAAAKAAYVAYLASDYGEITVDGLPADQEVGSKRISLEHLFVPLHLERARPDATLTETEGVDAAARKDAELSESNSDEAETESSERLSVGAALASSHRLAVLGPPGSGKTTLLKRLAVAYGIPERRGDVADDLPDHPWLPLVVRCRQLGARVTEPVVEILRDIPRWAEISNHAEGFNSLVDGALRDGTGLLLIDGLDEIGDDAARIAFVRQLRTFLATYPKVGVIATSREAGFRVVAGALADVCARYRLAEFDQSDITQLTLAWFRLVVGDSQGVEDDARTLAEQIVETDRVRQLAVNPLLLTTLLLVRRWVGEVPRKRSILYAKAIEVLLMTWNVEGHDPIDLEEAVPQLAYVAYAMTANDQQTVSAVELRQLLLRARESLPEVLGYARTPPNAFIDRIEQRSSLLSLSGHALEAGTVVPVYEFKHLTFQEYLTAVACVEGFYGTGGESSLTELLGPRLSDSDWREIVPLTAVLAGRRAAPLVELLVDSVEKVTEVRGAPKTFLPTVMLAQALADEAQLPPSLVDRASAALAVRPSWSFGVRDLVSELMSSKYGERFRAVVAERYLGAEPGFEDAGSLHSRLLMLERQPFLPGELKLDSAWVERVTLEVQSDEPNESANAALRIMRLAFGFMGELDDLDDPDADEVIDWLAKQDDPLARIIESPSPPAYYAATWAFAWMGSVAPVPIRSSIVLRIMPRLMSLWKAGESTEIQEMAAWAFAWLPLVDRKAGAEAIAPCDAGSFTTEQATAQSQSGRDDRARASLVAAYYLRSYSDDELLAMAQDADDPGATRVESALSSAADNSTP